MNTYKVVIREKVTNRCLTIHECYAMNESQAIESAKERYPLWKDNPMKASLTTREK